ncbi:MAG: ATP-binding protein [Elusimicrobiota bacterium]
MINKSILKEILLTNEEFIKTRAGKLVPRVNIKLPSELNKVIIFYGVRRCGKTHILYDLFLKNKDNSFYMDFEDERLQGFKLEDFENLRESFFEIKPNLINKEINLFLDEVHNIPGWEKFARRMVEKENARIFVTGSSSKIMPREIQTSLRGRSWSIEVNTFSFLESLSIKNVKLEKHPALSSSLKLHIKNYFNDYLHWGGFPEVLLLSDDYEKGKILNEYMEAMFFKDLVERFNVSNTRLLSMLMETLFSSFAAKFSLTSFYKKNKQNLPFSKDTLFAYYKHFLESMLVYEVRIFSESSYKRQRNPSKLYLADLGLCKRTASADLGRMLENLVFLNLRKNNREVYYFSEINECDFIVKDYKGLFTSFQVTHELSDNNRARELDGLVSACERLKLKEGLLLTSGQEDSITYKKHKVKILPVWKWLIQ